jgi:HD-like signal output (HDOD) protein
MTASMTETENRSSSTDPVLAAVLRVIAHDGVKVPPIPAVVARLSEQLANPNFDLRQVAQLVGTDQALAAHILRCASSTLFAARGQVTSLIDAVMRVGANGLFTLAVSFSMGRDIARATPLQSVRRDVFRKAAATAEFCRRLAPRFGADPEGGFLCGLLGRFGLTVALGAIEQAIAARQVKETLPAAAWMEIARRCEESIAADVAADWCMPKLVGDVIAARRRADPNPALLPLVKLLKAAEDLTELFYSDAAPSAEDIAALVGCSEEAAAEIARSLPEVAASVWTLGSATDELKVSQSIHPPVVEPPPTTLKGSVVAVSIPVTVERKSGDQQLMCVSLASDGFVATGTQALPLNQVIKCRLLDVEEDLELVAFVAAVVHDGDYRFEMKPMGLTGPSARRWQQLRGEQTRDATGPEHAVHRSFGSGTSPFAAAAEARSARAAVPAPGSPLRRLGSWLRGRGDS